MSGRAVHDRRAERTAATRREILDATWTLVRADGLAALSMRDLGARVGMRAQSLYGYFDSKYAIFDALFADANHELLRRITEHVAAADPVTELRLRARIFLEFCVEDPVRYQLLFQRTIPRFEPTPESYRPALTLVEDGRAQLQACDIHAPGAFDAWTAVIAGLAAQQNSNEPGGDRWARLLDEVIDMYLEHYRPHSSGGSHESGRPRASTA